MNEKNENISRLKNQKNNHQINKQKSSYYIEFKIKLNDFYNKNKHKSIFFVKIVEKLKK